MKKIAILLTLLTSIFVNAQQRMPMFSELPRDVQSDVSSELSFELKLTPTQLRTVLSQIIIVADITRAMPGLDQGYLAVVEEPVYGEVRARFDIGILYGTQGSTSGYVANLINYSISQ